MTQMQKYSWSLAAETEEARKANLNVKSANHWSLQLSCSAHSLLLSQLSLQVYSSTTIVSISLYSYPKVSAAFQL